MPILWVGWVVVLVIVVALVCMIDPSDITTPPAGTTPPGVVMTPPELTTVPLVVPPVTTTGLPVTAGVADAPLDLGAGLMGGIWFGTVVPGVVMTGAVPVPITGPVGVKGTVFIVELLFRARRRANRPRRNGPDDWVVVVVTIGAGSVGNVTICACVTAVGAGAVTGGSSAVTGTANTAAIAAANRNLVMMLPPETA
jgi:hypothetical protein